MQQFILELPPTDQYNLEDFIISDCNKQAYHFVTNWTKNWGVNPYQYTVLIHGPVSCGKSFLSKIFRMKANAHFITPFSEETVITKYMVFIIEDIYIWPEKKLLHYFNLVNENRKYLLLTSNSNLSQFALNDLNSRINSLLKIEVLAPDHKLIKLLLFKLFSTHSVNLDRKVLEFLIVRLPGNFAKIMSVVERILTYATIYKRKVTIPLIKEVLYADKEI